MANSGKANVEVIKRMVGDIRFFADAVRREGKKMADEAHGLRNEWNDPQYDKYERYIAELADDLIAGTSELDYCANELEKRWKELIDG